MVENTPDAPVPSSAMRASDADRERVADVLREAFAEGRLSPAEHDERLTATYAARTVGELAPVVADLPVPRGAAALPVRPSGPVAPTGADLSVRPDLAARADGDAVAVFAGFERRGRWVVPAHFRAICTFGGGELDLTQAQLTSHETVIRVRCVFGGLTITVPEGMAVRNSVRAYFGGHSGPSGDTPDGAPVLRVEGLAVFGGVDVRRPKRKKGEKRDRALPQ